MSNFLSLYDLFLLEYGLFTRKKKKRRVGNGRTVEVFFFSWVTVGVGTDHNLCSLNLKKHLLHSSSVHPPPYGNRAQTDLLFFFYISSHQTINNDQVDPNLSFLVHLFSGKLDLAL